MHQEPSLAQPVLTDWRAVEQAGLKLVELVVVTEDWAGEPAAGRDQCAAERAGSG